MNYNRLVRSFEGKRIAVIGDFMLDRYLWGTVSRVAPEAPVPVVEIEHESDHLGGAANVAQNIASLGATPYLLGVLGDDASGSRLLELMQAAGFQTDGIVIDASRPTTVKTRVMAHDQHVMRTDRETRRAIDGSIQKRLYRYLHEILPMMDGILVEDYNKGVLVQPLISRIVDLAFEEEKVITVDPKFNHFLDYRRVSVFKPNRKETEDILGMKLDSEANIRKAGIGLLELLQCKNVLITLGEDGMAVFPRNGKSKQIHTTAKRVYDVSGAGDTVIATLTLAMAVGAGIWEAAELANFAAGIIVGEVGTVPITRNKLIEPISHSKKQRAIPQFDRAAVL